MIISTIHGVKIEAVYSCVPQYEIDNRAFTRETFGEEWDSIIRATGIEKRRVCRNKTTTALDLSVEAAKTLFQETSLDRNTIGGIVFVTLTPDNLMPNNASAVQTLLDLPANIAAFDINHACSGYVYGLWISALMANTLNKKILFLDGDSNSHYISPYDRATAILFGDAGSATLLAPDNPSSSWDFTFFTESEQRDALIIPGFGFRELLSPESLAYEIYPDGSRRRKVDMAMDSERVFNYVIKSVPKILKDFMAQTNTCPDDFDCLLFHQANGFMLRQVARRIKFPLEKMPISLNKFGNTSSVSIPLTITSEISDLLQEEGSKVLMSGFGAGLATGAAIVQFEKDLSIGLVERDL